MKKIFSIIAAIATVGTAMTGSLASCTDMGGDGVDSVLWEGSQNPENTSYRNPVWEPSLEAGTVFKAASVYVAISSETEWAKGLKYCCPVVTSNDLMSWNFTAQTAFNYPAPPAEDEEEGETTATSTIGLRPSWTEARIANISADFAKTVSGANYWMVYQPEGENAIGAASSTSGQGPYTDQGAFITAEKLGVSKIENPFFVVFSTKFYVCYTTENGSYVQEVTLRRGQKPTLKGTAKQVAGPEFSDIAIYRTSSSSYYIFGTVKNGSGTEVRYARATAATGPYTDKAGNDLVNGSNGELLIEGGDENVNPENVCRVFADGQGVQYVAYNATAAGKELMASNYKRRPLFISPMELDEEGWFKGVIVPNTGWTTPRFSLD